MGLNSLLVGAVGCYIRTAPFGGGSGHSFPLCSNVLCCSEMYAKRKVIVIFIVVTSVISFAILWAHLILLFQESHWGSLSLVCSEVCSVTRSRLSPFLLAGKISIISALPVVFLSPSDQAHWSPTSNEVIHHPGQVSICEKCLKAWMNFLSTAGCLKYPEIFMWSTETWAVSWSVRHQPAALQRLGTITFC